VVHFSVLVTTGLDPVVHAEAPLMTTRELQNGTAAWIAGSSPAMTT